MVRRAPMPAFRGPYSSATRSDHKLGFQREHGASCLIGRLTMPNCGWAPNPSATEGLPMARWLRRGLLWAAISVDGFPHDSPLLKKEPSRRRGWKRTKLSFTPHVARG